MTDVYLLKWEDGDYFRGFGQRPRWGKGQNKAEGLSLEAAERLLRENAKADWPKRAKIVRLKPRAAAATPATGFDKFVDEQMRSPSFAQAYVEADAEVQSAASETHDEQWLAAAKRDVAANEDAARIRAQRAAAAAIQEAERAVLDAAKEHLAAEDAWSSSQGEYEEQQAAFARYCDAQDALYETTKALLEKERALLALRAEA